MTWLPHLNSEIMYEARGFELDAYIIGLEGWRRGLTLKWHVKNDEYFDKMRTWYVDQPGKLFSLSNEKHNHYFFRTRGDLVTNEAVDLAMDKNTTAIALEKKGIPHPKSTLIDISEDIKTILEKAIEVGYPVVVKPVNGSFGRGVITNISTPEMLSDVLANYSEKYPYKELLIESYIDAKDFRLYVVGDEVVAAIERIKPHVIGDGKHTVLELVSKKNELRKQNPRLVSCLININSEMKYMLSTQGKELRDIPNSGETVWLGEVHNVSKGGDSKDVLDDLPKNIKDLAISALQSIEGLHHGAVDVLVSDSGEAYVLELNPTAQIGSLVFPMYGMPRDVPSKIIDYYFPETKTMPYRSKLFFDFYDLLEPLNNRVATQTVVSTPPLGQVYGRQYTVDGDVLNIDYHRGLRKHAFENKLSGYVSVREDNKIDVVVVGSDLEIVENFDQAIYSDPERSTVTGIEVKNFDEPVKVGFEVKADRKLQLLTLQETSDNIKAIDKDIKYLEKKINKYYRSLSWKITYPVRWGGGLVKVIKQIKNRTES